MTHHTEAERAEFEDLARQRGWSTTPHGTGYDQWSTQQAWVAWQAARRAPAAPVPQGLREAAQRAHDWMERQQRQQSKGGHATFDMMMLREERDALAEALAAAPQPPEVGCSVSNRETLEAPHAFQTEGGLKSEIRTTSTAPVQMPEPVGYLNTHGTYERTQEYKEELRCAKGKELEYLIKSRTAVYTEPQVRQLLAAHGVKGERN